MSQRPVAVYRTFEEFYPFYLSEHSNPDNRTLHFVGTTLVILLAVFVAFTGQLRLLLLAPLIGYGFAWVGHFVFGEASPLRWPRVALRRGARPALDEGGGPCIALRVLRAAPHSRARARVSPCLRREEQARHLQVPALQPARRLPNVVRHCRRQAAVAPQEAHCVTRGAPHPEASARRNSLCPAANGHSARLLFSCSLFFALCLPLYSREVRGRMRGAGQSCMPARREAGSARALGRRSRRARADAPDNLVSSARNCWEKSSSASSSSQLSCQS